MRKKILYGTMCIALSVMLIGCNSKSDNSANSNSTSDIAQMTALVFKNQQMMLPQKIQM